MLSDPVVRAVVLVAEGLVESASDLASAIREEFTVISVLTGAQVLDRCALNPPDLLVLAVELLDMTGYQVLQCLRADPRLAVIPIMLVAERGQVADSSEIANSVDCDFLVKPVSSSVVCSRVRAQLAESQARRKVAEQLAQSHAELQREVSARHDAIARADFLRTHDSLTGLHNARTLCRRLDQRISRVARGRQAIALIILDIDRFTRLNNSFGREACDEVLQVMAKRLGKVREASDLFMAARQGVDSFCLVFDDGGESPPEQVALAAHARALSLQKIMTEPVSVGGQELTVSMSVGVAIFPNDAETAEALMAAAEHAVETAKRQGGSTIALASKHLTSEFKELVLLENQLRRAIASGEIKPWYQPQLRAHSLTLCGVEALARWRLEDGSFVSPTRFIPLAEQCGLIHDLSRSMLHQACMDARDWARTLSEPPTVAINISPQQFSHRHFVPELQQILSASGAPASLISLEITESLALSDSRHIAENFKELKSMGLRLALDDFGTGYSSFAMLKDLPLDEMKIDQSFVRPMPQDRKSAGIVVALLTLAQQLGISTVAEGIESTAQRDFLEHHGCQILQGDLFSSAVPAAQIISRSWPR